MPKRTKGEGSVRLRKDGRWEGRYAVGTNPDTGKTMYKNVLGKTKTETLLKMRDAMEKNKTINFANASRNATVEQWLKEWFNTYSKPNLKHSTASQYELFIKCYIIPRIGKIKITELKQIQVQRMINDLHENGRINDEKESGLSAKTVKETYRVLNSAMEQAVEANLILRNPCRGCKLPKDPKKEMKTLPEEKIAEYLAAADARGMLPFFYLELTTGLRRGEILALEWNDIDIDNCMIHISKSVIRIDGDMEVTTPKTANGTRDIFISEKALEYLIEEHNQHPNSKYVFPSPVKKEDSMRDPRAVYRLHKKILNDIGEDPEIRFHDLRHTYATMAIQNGVNIKAVSQTLGHYSVGFTLDTYTHATSKLKSEAAKEFGDVFEDLMMA